MTRTLTDWKARRSGAAMTVIGSDVNTGGGVTLTNVALIEMQRLGGELVVVALDDNGAVLAKLV
jgi:hypothetical protein